jgi:hypothetical protein
MQLVALQTVLPTGRSFCRKTQKLPQKNIGGRENPRPNFLQICHQTAEKWLDFFEVWFSHKILDTMKKKTVKSTELPIAMPSESLLTSIQTASI